MCQEKQGYGIQTQNTINRSPAGRRRRRREDKMEYSRIGDTCVVRMDKGENIMETLKVLCAKEDIRLAQVDALGAVDHAEMRV